MESPQIQVLIDGTDLTEPLRQALDRMNASLDLRALNDETQANRASTANARVVLTNDLQSLSKGRLHYLRGWVRRQPCPTLICSNSCGKDVPVPDLADEEVPVTFLRNPNSDVLVGHLSAICSVSQKMNAIHEEVVTLRNRELSLQAKVRRLGGDLQRAGNLQRDLLPQDLPDCIGLDIHTLYRPAEIVSGDCYDVVRVSPTKIAVTIADATGHGLAAGLLCASFVRSICRSAEDRGNVDPARVLSLLNREICAADLSECLFVTALYAVYDETTGVVRLARAGAPYPIHVRRNRDSTQVRSDGPAAGMIPNVSFEPVEIALQPGDALVFHTDGLDELVTGAEPDTSRRDFSQSDWFRSLQTRSSRQSLIELDAIAASRNPTALDRDDVTAVVLERHQTVARIPESRNRLPTSSRKVAVLR